MTLYTVLIYYTSTQCLHGYIQLFIIRALSSLNYYNNIIIWSVVENTHLCWVCGIIQLYYNMVFYRRYNFIWIIPFVSGYNINNYYNPNTFCNMYHDYNNKHTQWEERVLWKLIMHHNIIMWLQYCAVVFRFTKSLDYRHFTKSQLLY